MKILTRLIAFCICLLLLFSCGCAMQEQDVMSMLCERTDRLQYREVLAGDWQGELTDEADIRAVLSMLCEVELVRSEEDGLPSALYTASMLMGQLSMQCSVPRDKATYGVSVTKGGLLYVTVIEADGNSTVYYSEEGAVDYDTVLRLLVEAK